MGRNMHWLGLADGLGGIVCVACMCLFILIGGGSEESDKASSHIRAIFIRLCSNKNNELGGHQGSRVCERSHADALKSESRLSGSIEITFA